MFNMTSKKLIIEELLQTLSQDYTSGIFVPILEADVVGYLYHLWILRFGSASRVHLDTRVCVNPNKKFDFVIGEVDYHGKRPCIGKPEFVIEVKSFPSGFTDQQHRVHYFHIIENDIPKLANMKEPSNNRYILLFDEDDYLKGFDTASKTSRISWIMQVRDELDSRIKIVHVKKIGKSIEWKLL